MGVNYRCQIWYLEGCWSCTYPIDCMYTTLRQIPARKRNEALWKAIARSAKYNPVISLSVLLLPARPRRCRAEKLPLNTLIVEICLPGCRICIQQTRPAFTLMCPYQAVLYLSEWKRESEAKHWGGERQMVLLWESKWRGRCHQARFGRSTRGQSRKELERCLVAE